MLKIVPVLLYFTSQNFEWTVKAMIIMFSERSLEPLPRFQKLGGVIGKIFWEKNGFGQK